MTDTTRTITFWKLRQYLLLHWTKVPAADCRKNCSEEKLQRVTGKTITLTEKVDPSVLGGLRLDLGGTRLDGTVQGRLERLRNEISGVVI